MRLNFEKTVRRKRLIENNRNFDRKSEVFIGYLISILWIGLLVFISLFTLWNNLEEGFILVWLLSPLILITIYGILMRDRLLSIKATNNLELNKTIAKNHLKKVFNKNTFIDTGAIWTSRRYYKFMNKNHTIV